MPSLACAALLLPGCFLAHETGDGSCMGSPRRDSVCCASGAPVAPESTCPFVCPRGSFETVGSCAPTGPSDAGPAPGPIDAGLPLTCPLVRADATCLESFLVAPGRPFELPVTFDTCGCCAESQCRAEVDVATQTLRLGTALCPDPCDCDACIAPRATCAVPALSEGLWNVVVNGAPAFELPVFSDPGLVPPPPACASYAEPDRCATSERIEPTVWIPDEVCVAPRPGGGTDADVIVTVASNCWSCPDLKGSCVATLEPRYTDDLPPGGEIRLAPTRHLTECDVACPDICMRAEQRCLVPPLTPGHVYRVWTGDGRSVLTFTAGETGEICAAGALPPG